MQADKHGVSGVFRLDNFQADADWPTASDGLQPSAVVGRIGAIGQLQTVSPAVQIARKLPFV